MPALAQVLQRLDLNDGAGPVAAAANDGVSVTYAGGNSACLFGSSPGCCSLKYLSRA